MLRAKQFLLASLCLGILTAAAAAADNDKYKGGKLRKRDFSGQLLERHNFNDADLELAIFKQCRLAGSTFREADLTSASFADADCSGVDFRTANLLRTHFQTTNLSKANFEGQNLQGVSFLYCDLRGANFKGTKNWKDLNRADLRGADLRGANLRAADNASSAKFTGAKYDKATQWPDGFDVEKSGAVLADSGKAALSGTDTSATKTEIKNMPTDAPKLEIIKALIEKQWGPAAQGGTKHVYNYKSFKFADARKSDYPKKGTMNFPVNVVCEITVQFRDGSSRQEKKDQRFEFYKDEFGEWTYRFIQNN